MTQNVQIKIKEPQQTITNYQGGLGTQNIIQGNSNVGIQNTVGLQNAFGLPGISIQGFPTRGFSSGLNLGLNGQSLYQNLFNLGNSIYIPQSLPVRQGNLRINSYQPPQYYQSSSSSSSSSSIIGGNPLTKQVSGFYSNDKGDQIKYTYIEEVVNNNANKGF